MTCVKTSPDNPMTFKSFKTFFKKLKLKGGQTIFTAFINFKLGPPLARPMYG